MTTRRTEPSVSLLKGATYTPSSHSDIRVRFAAMREEEGADWRQAEETEQQQFEEEHGSD